MIKLITQDERFWYSLDGNMDDSITISDINNLVESFLTTPGDLIYYYAFAALNRVPGILNFFELSHAPDSYYGNWGSSILSILVWLLLWGIVWVIIDENREKGEPERYKI